MNKQEEEHILAEYCRFTSVNDEHRHLSDKKVVDDWLKYARIKSLHIFAEMPGYPIYYAGGITNQEEIVLLIIDMVDMMDCSMRLFEVEDFEALFAFNQKVW